MDHTVALVVFAGLFLWMCSEIVAVVQSPLNAIPNAHFTAPFSRIWLLWVRATGKEFSACLAAHRRLGPVIRLGPKELSIDCIEDGVRTVYGGNWDKSSMYDKFTYLGLSPLFAIRQAKPHAERKRFFAHAYSKSTVDRSIELRQILDVIGHDRLQPRLRKLATTEAIANVFPLTKEYSMDVVTAYIYGLDSSINCLDNPVETSRYLKAFQTPVEPWSFFASTEIPQLAGLLEQVGVNLISPSVLSALQTVESLVLELTSNVTSTLQAKHGDGSASSWFFRQLWQRLDNVPETQKIALLACDMVDQVHAGHEATGITLTYLMWELSRNGEIQDRLRDELRSLSNAGQSPEHSELLGNILMETLRLYPASGGSFPRVAPLDANIAGFAVPAQTIVTASPYTLGRNPDIFPDPELWLPERWENANVARKRQMKQWVWSFGSGSRICIGEHLAMLAMKMFIIEIYSNYKTTIAVHSDMRQLETFFSIPADEALYLNFEAV